MTRLLFCTEAFEMNGVLRSLLDLLAALDPKRYEISLFAFDGRLPAHVALPPGVRLLPALPECAIARMPLAVAGRWALKQGQVRLFLKRVLLTLLGLASPRFSKGRLVSGCRALPGAWDVVCAYSMGLLWEFAVTKVTARKRILWLHTDPRVSSWRPTWLWYRPFVDRVDGLVCVSRGIRDAVRALMPGDAAKVRCVHNIVDAAEIRRKAEAVDAPPKVAGRLRLVTVGRFSPPKKQVLIPAMAKVAKEAGVDFEWYLVGPGAARARREKAGELAAWGLTERLHYVEGLANPYGLMRSADVYVQPSWYEGWGLTLTEALVLGRYCLATDIPSFREQVTEPWQGRLLPLDAQAFGEAVVCAARHPEVLHPPRRYHVPWTAEAVVAEFEEVLGDAS